MQSPKQKIDLSIITPVYNEEKNIEIFINTINDIVKTLTYKYEIIFVLDPSNDGTEREIRKRLDNDSNIKLIKMSRRFGQPSATIAGIHNSSGEKVVIMDVDLQDPPELIVDMYKKIESGFDVVAAKRKSRAGETFFKEKISEFGYKIINYFSDINIPKNVGDFRMINLKVVNEIKKLKESHGFLRGMVSFVGFKQTTIEFDRKARKFGNSKYNKFTGSFDIGLNGLFCYSNKPLYLILISSIILFFLSFALLILKIFYPIQNLIVIMLTLFAFNFLFIGIIGQYIGRIYDQVKNRPIYIIEEKINFN